MCLSCQTGVCLGQVKLNGIGKPYNLLPPKTVFGPVSQLLSDRSRHFVAGFVIALRRPCPLPPHDNTRAFSGEDRVSWCAATRVVFAPQHHLPARHYAALAHSN